jgi:hypothetical protein
MQISMESNIKEFSRGMDKFQRKQIPFAVKLALDATAFDGQRAVKANIEKKFILRNKWTVSGVRVKKANKARLISSVYMASGRDYMMRQETGGIRTPKGNSISVPQRVRGKKSTKISKARRPTTLLNNTAKFFKVDVGNADPRSRHLPPGIYQRMGGKKNRKLKMMYASEPRTVYRKRFGFEKTMIGITKNKFGKNLQRSFDRAMRTARK